LEANHLINYYIVDDPGLTFKNVSGVYSTISDMTLGDVQPVPIYQWGYSDNALCVCG